MIPNKVNLTKAEIKELIKILNNVNNNQIFLINRKEETGKNPYVFFLEVGINVTDAYEIIKKLSLNDYQYSQLDGQNNFLYMHVFFKNINGKTAYIKIGFKNDKTVVISFHEKKFD